jgi:hypothetical protein
MSERPSCGHWDATFSCAECVARVRREYPEFPLQVTRGLTGPVSVPWEVADRAWAAYSALYGRGQSVERLAQRGGFSWGEMDSLFPGWRQATDEWVQLRAELATVRGVSDALEKQVALLTTDLDNLTAEIRKVCWRTARAAPVSGPPRPLRSSPHPQHGLYPAYTLMPHRV